MSSASSADRSSTPDNDSAEAGGDELRESDKRDVDLDALSGAEWPSGEAIREVLDVETLYRQTLSRISANQMLAQLRRVPPHVIAPLVGAVGLSPNSRVNKGVASALLRVAQTKTELLAVLTSPLVRLFRASPATIAEWTDFLSGQPSSLSVHDHAYPGDSVPVPVFLGELPSLLTAPFHFIGLLCGILVGPNPVAALVLAAAENNTAREALDLLRNDYPALPEAALTLAQHTGPTFQSLSEFTRDVGEEFLRRRVPGAGDLVDLSSADGLVEVVRGRSGTLKEAGFGPAGAETNVVGAAMLIAWCGAAIGDTAFDSLSATANSTDAGQEAGAGADEVAPAGPDEHDTALAPTAQVARNDESAWVASPHADGTEQLQRLVDALESLDWEEAALAAQAAADSLEVRLAPDADDLGTVTRFVGAAQALADEVADLVGHPVPAAHDDMDEALTQARSARGEDSVWQDLLGAQAPEGFDDALEQLRALAAAAQAGALPAETKTALVSLHRLAQQCAGRRQHPSQNIDYTELTTWEGEARSYLPVRAHPAITAAVLGDLTFPGPDAAAAAADPPSQGTAPDRSDADPADPVDSVDPTRAQENVEGQPANDEVPQKDDSAARDVTTGDEPGPDAEDGPGDEADGVVDTVTDDMDAAEASVGGAHEEPEAHTDEELLDQLRASLGAGVDQNLTRTTDRAPDDAAAARPEGPPRTASGDTVAEAPHPEAEPHDGFAGLRVAEGRLLVHARYGAAALLHHDPAHRAARALPAYAQHLTAPAGSMAAAFAAAATDVTRDSLSDDRPGQILAWAAAVRVALVAPAAGAAAVLGELAPCVAGHRSLAAVGAAFEQAALSGAIVLPEVAGDLLAVDEAETAAREASHAAASLLEAAPRRSIKYAPANGVYQNWMSPHTGLLGVLLSEVATDDPTNITHVLEVVTSLRGDAERRLDDTFAKIRRGARKEKIVGGARSTLVNAFNDILELATMWAENATAVRERRQQWGGSASRANRPLETLRGTLLNLRTPALAELDELRENVDSDDPAEAAYSAAAQAAAQMLTVAFTISDGHPPVGIEPSPDWALRAELLGTDLDLDLTLRPQQQDTTESDPGTQTPATTGTPDDEAGTATTEPADVEHDEHDDLFSSVQRRLSSLAAHPWDPEKAFDERTRRGEHDLTAIMLTNLQATSPTLVNDLRARRESALDDQRADLAVEADRVEALIRISLRDATLPDEVATGLGARVEACRSPRRTDLRRVRHTLAAVNDLIAQHRRAQIVAARERITSARTNSAVDDNADLLTGLVESGEVAGALEYLEQLLATGRLPERRDDGAHFDVFYPAVPNMAAKAPDLLESLRRRLDPNEADPGAAVAGSGKSVDKLLSLLGTDLDDIAVDTRRRAAAGIGAWLQLMSPRQVTVGEALRPVLALAGYEFSAARIGQRQHGRTWIQLSGLSALGHAMSPALGSAMSRGGSSLRVLLVKSTTTPSTVIDWMRHERSEDTVVVLHPVAYSASERRQLANASRGRPHPVSILVDPAVIAYLALQPEHRRSTLAELTLPFTADSPYRDRAGRAAPEMFYGRAGERRLVMDLEGPSFVSGGRQLGKSALLYSSRDEFDDRNHRRSVLLEIRPVGAEDDPDQLWPRLMSALADADIVDPPEAAGLADAQAVEDAIRAFIDVDPDQRRLLILLDEADLFLDADAAGNRFAHISRCKHIMDSTGRRVKFVFAGLHRTSRFESLPNQPLAHLGPPVIVGPLKPQAAYDLITRPLAALGYRFADPTQQPARILAFTNNVPSLLQLFGRSLIAHMTSREIAAQGPPVIIEDDDITAVLEDANLLDAFREKYLLTLRLDQRYTAIVYAIAYDALRGDLDRGLTLSELDDACRSYWPAGFAEVSRDHLRGLVTECCDLGVLAAEDRRYRMRTQTMLRLLGTLDQVEETLLMAAERFTLPSASDVESHRSTLSGSSRRFPLTTRQIAQVLSGDSPVLVVAGTTALGIQWVVPCLEQLDNDGASRARTVRQINPTRSALSERYSAADAPNTDQALLVLDVRGSEPEVLTDLLAKADELTVDSRPSGSNPAKVVIVFVADESSSPAWSDRLDILVELDVLNLAGLRSWCEEVGAPFHGTDDHTRLLEASGGWLKVLSDTLTETAVANTEAAELLATARAAHTDPARAADLLTETGLRSQPGPGGPRPQQRAALLAQTFAVVADLTMGEPDSAEPGQSAGDQAAAADELVAVCSDYRTSPTSQTLGELATALGYRSLEEVLITLRTCGALRSNLAGLLYAEPTLHSATRATSGPA